ncbi:ATP-binding cassette domain-containing protein [Streptomyces sp. NPDC052676]|uniref:ATP-binding cassette domain-containing protein n=1 Tax=Streptomyces sp. NPDC052676 TaxID=3154953 RepID=UPI00344463CD
MAKPWTTRRGTAHLCEDGPQVITARNVSFTYPGADNPALDGINLDLKRGEVLAPVGENGAGKSTLARLLTGLYLPTTGSVTWDAMDLADADPASVLSKVALVPQDYTRWPLAARENITLGQPRPEGDSAVHAAAEAAGADTVITHLPHGLDTSLARSWWGGHDLSGGQSGVGQATTHQAVEMVDGTAGILQRLERPVDPGTRGQPVSWPPPLPRF